MNVLKKFCELHPDEWEALPDRAIEVAQRLIFSLSGSDVIPLLGIQDDGSLLIEWARRDLDNSLTMVSVILNCDKNELIFSLMKKGKVDSYGALCLSETTFEMMDSLMIKTFLQ